jgi:hypothetical protein
MKAFLHSFAAGVGSVLGLFPTLRGHSLDGTELEAIGKDFGRVGRDIRVSTEQYALDAKPKERLKASDGEEKVEQLELIHTHC